MQSIVLHAAQSCRYCFSSESSSSAPDSAGAYCCSGGSGRAIRFSDGQSGSDAPVAPAAAVSGGGGSEWAGRAAGIAIGEVAVDWQRPAGTGRCRSGAAAAAGRAGRRGWQRQFTSRRRAQIDCAGCACPFHRCSPRFRLISFDTVIWRSERGATGRTVRIARLRSGPRVAALGAENPLRAGAHARGSLGRARRIAHRCEMLLADVGAPSRVTLHTSATDVGCPNGGTRLGLCAGMTVRYRQQSCVY